MNCHQIGDLLWIRYIGQPTQANSGPAKTKQKAIAKKKNQLTNFEHLVWTGKSQTFALLYWPRYGQYGKVFVWKFSPKTSL